MNYVNTLNNSQEVICPYYWFSNSFIFIKIVYDNKEAKKMDIFEVLSAISKKKKAFIHSGTSEYDALIKQNLKSPKNIIYRFLTSRSWSGHRFKPVKSDANNSEFVGSIALIFVSYFLWITGANIKSLPISIGTEGIRSLGLCVTSSRVQIRSWLIQMRNSIPGLPAMTKGYLSVYCNIVRYIASMSSRK